MQQEAFVVQSLSCIQLFAIPWTAARQATLSFTISTSLLRLMSIGDAIQPSHPLSSPSPPAFSLSQHQVIFFPSGGLKYWNFSFSISASNEYSGLISFRMDWFDLAVQGTLKSLLQHHSLKHQFFDTQLSLWSNSQVHT